MSEIKTLSIEQKAALAYESAREALKAAGTNKQPWNFIPSEEKKTFLFYTKATANNKGFSVANIVSGFDAFTEPEKAFVSLFIGFAKTLNSNI